MNAIPTLYSGVQFRSLLEARWAAWFDLTGRYEWTYEPFELSGYIPDFLVRRLDEPWRPDREWLHEVKPAANALDLFMHVEKLDESGWAGSFMIGSSPDVMLLRPCDVRGAACWSPWTLDRQGWNRANNAVQWKSPA